MIDRLKGGAGENPWDKLYVEMEKSETSYAKSKREIKTQIVSDVDNENFSECGSLAENFSDCGSIASFAPDLKSVVLVPSKIPITLAEARRQAKARIQDALRALDEDDFKGFVELGAKAIEVMLPHHKVPGPVA